jgi:hypothetical protein
MPVLLRCGVRARDSVQYPRVPHLTNQLRPELVRAWHTPLSSDAYSYFGRHGAGTHNAEVRPRRSTQATAH